MPIPQLTRSESGTPATPLPPASSTPPASQKPRKRTGRRVALIAVIGLVLTIAILLANTLVVGGRILGGNGNVSIFEQIKHLIATPDRPVRGESEDRVNLLLLGIGGAGHEGPLLADTIIVASLKPSTKEVGFISIPRDLVVPFPKYEWRKINNALAFGLWLNYPGGGDTLMREMVELVTGLPIHYQARVDFAGFRQVVDDLGGIDVTVDKAFVDSQYPTENYGYQVVRFTAGPQHMDGETALRFVRSRYGSSGEGSDFARSRRQQKVLVTIKEKALSFGTLINPKRISDALTTLGTHVSSNLELWEMVRFGKLAEGVDQNAIMNIVLDAATGSPLVAATGTDNGYILQPRSGNFEEVHYLADNLFLIGRAEKERAKIAVENGTTATGLAQQFAAELEHLNYDVVQVNTVADNRYPQTIIYDMSGGTKPNTLASLQQRLAAKVEPGLPSFLDDSIDPGRSVNANGSVKGVNEVKIDFLIILGEDQKSTSSTASSKGPRLPATKSAS